MGCVSVKSSITYEEDYPEGKPKILTHLPTLRIKNSIHIKSKFHKSLRVIVEVSPSLEMSETSLNSLL